MFDNAIYLFIYEHKDTKTQRNNDKGRKVYKETSLDFKREGRDGVRKLRKWKSKVC